MEVFCTDSRYVWTEDLVDHILETEHSLKNKTEKSNLLSQFPRIRLSCAKLLLGWIASTMIYNCILLGGLPGGVLENNCYIGILTLVTGPLLVFILISRFAFRRIILTTVFVLVGILAFLIGYLESGKS